jgi:FHA domain-containing protein
MQRVGELLAAACDGTVALLQARATLKQQLRADVTMIGARNNNPLKFVPDGASALNQLLSPRPARGFMDARTAMRDAYDDLLAHQIGFVAGMRAAMQGLIGRFDPAVLEGRLASKSVLDAMLPAARKARLWELFNSLYADVSREAEDDFERLFGHAFVKAYEEQIARIEAAAVHPNERQG